METLTTLSIDPKHIPAIKKRNEARVCDLLRWTPDEYKWFMYNTALKYLEEYLNNDEAAINDISKSKAFWSWWKMAWMHRDSAFVEEWDGTEYYVELADCASLYRDMHNPKILVCELTIPANAYPKDFTIIKSKIR